VLDGVAYHQGAAGVKVLQGDERTPFMTVTQLDRDRSRQVGSRRTIVLGQVNLQHHELVLSFIQDTSLCTSFLMDCSPMLPTGW
jgi:hypothetical protein